MSTLLKIHLLLRKKLFSQKFLAGFSVIEVIMAAALFLIFSGGLVTLVLQGFNSNRLAEEETIASQYATEGMEAVRSIRNQGYTNLVNTTGTGVIQSNGVWTFSGANNTYASGKYTRVIAISSVNRDASNNIVSSGGTLDPNTKKAVVTVTWNYTPTRNDSVVLTNYFTNWRVTENTQSSGMLVYGDGGTTSNAVKYQIFNGLNWNTAAATATLGTANRALRAVRVYSATSQPVFDSAASAVQNSGTSLTFSDTVGSGTNRLLIVALAYRAHNNVNAEGLSVTYNGVPLNKITRNTNVDRDSEMWYLVAPASGAHNVVVTMSADPEDMVATAISYSNVNQTTPIGLPSLNSGNSTTMSVTVPSSSNQIVLGMASTYPNGNNNPITVDGTQRWNANTVTNNINSTGNEKTGGGAVTLNWTGLQAFQWTTIGIPINAATRTEKIAISRHYDGTVQYIYAQVYNGSSWGNVVLLSSWTASTFLDVQNFDGTYLANGNFMVVYSDNTVIPKMQTWNGTAWSGQTSLTTLGTSQIPNYVVLSTRPGTNEAMAAFFTQGSSSTTAEAITEYYSGSAWSAITTHSTAAPSNTRRYVDFAWSPNTTTIGALVYTNSSTDKTLRVRLWLANGSGGGAWGTAVARSTSQTNTFGAVSVIGVNGSTEFAACDKDTAVTPTINCYKVTYVSNAATWVTPTNSAIAAATDTGLERSFHLAYESNLGGTGEIVYSDNTNIPKLKTYTQSTSTWDAAATTISTGSFTLGVVKSVRAIPSTGTNDIAFFLTDANLGLYSVFWNGASNAVYTTSDGRAFTQHGTNGSATTEFWYDYAVDQF